MNVLYTTNYLYLPKKVLQGHIKMSCEIVLYLANSPLPGAPSNFQAPNKI